MLKADNVLVLAPHTDDGELGCGATIAKLIEQGSKLFYAAFSTADESVPAHFPKNQLELEVREATKILGIPQDNVLIFKYQVRKLNYVRQEILEELIRIKPIIQPDLVFLPSANDIHQDHRTIYEEGLRAFKFCSILGYELIWNNLSFTADTFVSLEEQHIQLKIKALEAYKTQEGKPYMSNAFIRSLAVVRGVQSGRPLAEAFENIRINL
ncbi:MAG: PIG-L family deacetylase [Saprospiraceae bacterium]|nr:PIG-L family deacetylase [Saprospiraceae bacterium]